MWEMWLETMRWSRLLKASMGRVRSEVLSELAKGRVEEWPETRCRKPGTNWEVTGQTRPDS